jgi:hypothetical protein
MSRLATTAGVVAAVAALVVTSAAFAVGVPAASAQTLDTTSPDRLDLSTQEAIDQYLLSLGVDPSTVLVQRGAWNYAGPTCPGLGWNCTTATRVVQIATGGFALPLQTLNGPTSPNTAECKASPPAADPVPPGFPTLPAGAEGCVIVQIAAAGDEEIDQEASCKVETTDSSATLPKQYCFIAQENETGGDNQASIDMKVDWTKQPTGQLADQEALAFQEATGGGDNQLQVGQTIALKAEGTSTKQDGYQSLLFSQEVCEEATPCFPGGPGGTGNNQAQLSQHQTLAAKSLTGGQQDQNTGTLGDPCEGEVEDANSCVEYFQYSGTGANRFKADQRHSAKATSESAAVTQIQGCDPNELLKPCGLEQAGIQQREQVEDESANNLAKVVQDADYVLEAPDGEGLKQTQDPHFGGAVTFQVGGDNDLFELYQTAELRALPEAFVPMPPEVRIQSHENDVADSSFGVVSTRSEITLNNERSVITCYDPDGGVCMYEQRCSSFTDETENCPENFTQPPVLPPEFPPEED